jgi:hypothetical protein
VSKERELLKKIHYCWICATDLDDEDPEIKALNEVMREAEHYLFHEPEANCYGDGNVYRGVRSKDSEVKTVYVKTAESARKPMTEDEIAEEYTSYMSEWYAFEAGVRLAEQHHGILEEK